MSGRIATPDFYVCSEMKKLREGLTKRGIEWKDMTQYGPPRHEELWICRTKYDYHEKTWSVIHGFGTYGGFSHFVHDCGKLELMVGLYGEPIGRLTAAEVFKLMDKEGNNDTRAKG